MARNPRESNHIIYIAYSVTRARRAQNLLMYLHQQGTCEAGATVVFVIDVAECYRPFLAGQAW